MQNTFKKLPGSKIDLEVTLTPEEFNAYWQAEYENALSKVNLKGFRPGTAPKELADQAIDKEHVFNDAANEAIKISLNKTAEENDWHIIDQPKIEVLEVGSGEWKVGKKENTKVGLKYKAEMTIFPEINLGGYKEIAEKILKEKKEQTIEPKEIDKTLNWLRESRAKLTRAAHQTQKGNLVEVNIETTIDGQPLAGGKINNDRFVLGESRYIPGFDENLLNHKEGEDLNFSVTAPADYWQASLQNKKIDFKVRLNAVFDRELPELNDDFAKGLNGNFTGLENLKTNISDGLEIEKENKEQERLRGKILEEISKSSKIDLPEIMIEKTLVQMAEEAKQMMAHGNHPSVSDDELKTRLKDKARERVIASLVLHKISEAERLEPSKEEIEAEVMALRLDLNKNYDYAYTVARNKKVFQFLERN